MHSPIPSQSSRARIWFSLRVVLFVLLLPASQVCVGMAPKMKVVNLGPAGPDGARLRVESGQTALPEYQTRVNGGFWSTWRRPGLDGSLEVHHPRLRLVAQHVIEVRVRDGASHSAASEPVAVTIEE